MNDWKASQACYDAAEPNDELAPAEPVRSVLENVLQATYDGRVTESIEPVYDLSDRQATAAIWIDGHEYSLTLNREDA